MVGLKDPKSFDEQIEILKARGLIIDNIDGAKFILSNINYYRFTAYLLPFKTNDDKYNIGTSFKKIYEIYMFDKELRILLMNILGTIEISFRTYIAYALAIAYGTYGYTQSKNFINKGYHIDFLLRLEKEKSNNANKLFIKHHNDKYDGKLPIWVATEIMPFGMLSKLYSNLIPDEKSFIKKNLCKENPDLVDSWLQSLTHLRNQCAHYGRIYNELFPIVKVKNKDKKYELDTRRIFIHILVMKYLIADEKIWTKFFICLQQLINEYKEYIDLKLMGFPENWIEILSKK